MRRRFQAGLASVLLFALLATAPVADADPRVRRISFEGIEAVPAHVLEKSMLTRTRSRFRFWKARPEFPRGVLEDDLGRIAQSYRSRGYYWAVARFEIVDRGEGAPSDIVIHVVEGEPVTLTGIDRVRLGVDKNDSPTIEIEKQVHERVTLRYGRGFGGDGGDRFIVEWRLFRKLFLSGEQLTNGDSGVDMFWRRDY
jgi:hypothetical protein